LENGQNIITLTGIFATWRGNGGSFFKNFASEFVEIVGSILSHGHFGLSFALVGLSRGLFALGSVGGGVFAKFGDSFQYSVLDLTDGFPVVGRMLDTLGKFVGGYFVYS
jgi:hypothetical protein